MRPTVTAALVASLAAAAPLRPVVVKAPVLACTLPDARPPPPQRTFVSAGVDAAIAALQPRFLDPNLGTLFANALPNALDTTVFAHSSMPQLDSFLVTGDIPAMWLRDSTNQVLPYLRYIADDVPLRQLVAGLIGRHARSVLLDPYANAFQLDDLHGQGPHADDSTNRPAFAGTSVPAMTPAIFERKWEVDSLANTLRLAVAYYNATSDASPFDATWVAAVTIILQTFRSQQLDTAEEDAAGGPAYTFQRTAANPTDTLQQGRGMPVLHTGMIKSGFRGSDDACTFSFNVGENAFAAVQLRGAAGLLRTLGQTTLGAEADAIAADVEAGLAAYGTMQHPTAGHVWAYEVDGFGNALFMDDANIPGLLSMPYYGFAPVTDPLYLATRAAVLSPRNPFFFNGTAGAGVGGPHNGPYYIWPMAIIMQGWSATADSEVASVLATLVSASACTGLVHESFDRNSVFSYTRPWFAWVNSLFADFVLKVADERPHLIFKQ